MKFISNSKAIFSKHIKFLFLKADNFLKADFHRHG